ncbi:unnamed protein product [Linum trigynum]|uniref:Uncharacterized protein n=1 Tax=Linum trigynum TaxID=586398 RepID=A0AAV2F0D2_9ROSI
MVPLPEASSALPTWSPYPRPSRWSTWCPQPWYPYPGPFRLSAWYPKPVLSLGTLTRCHPAHRLLGTLIRGHPAYRLSGGHPAHQLPLSGAIPPIGLVSSAFGLVPLPGTIPLVDLVSLVQDRLTLPCMGPQRWSTWCPQS